MTEQYIRSIPFRFIVVFIFSKHLSPKLIVSSHTPMRVLLPLMLLLTGTTSSRSATGQTTMTTTPTTITTPTTSTGFRSGWAECTGISPSARQVHKSWRSFAQHAHPDTAGGSGDSNDFQNSVLLRDALKDPDHFQIYKLLQNLTTVIPFNESSNVPGGVVTTADLQVVQKCTNLLDKNSCAPYAKLRAQFSLAEPTKAAVAVGHRCRVVPRGRWRSGHKTFPPFSITEIRREEDTMYAAILLKTPGASGSSSSSSTQHRTVLVWIQAWKREAAPPPIRGCTLSTTAQYLAHLLPRCYDRCT